MTGVLTVAVLILYLLIDGPRVGIGYVLYHQQESHVLVPRIYGNIMKLSPSVIVIAILIGATPSPRAKRGWWSPRGAARAAGGGSDPGGAPFCG